MYILNMREEVSMSEQVTIIYTSLSWLHFVEVVTDNSHKMEVCLWRGRGRNKTLSQGYTARSCIIKYKQLNLALVIKRIGS